LSARNRPSGGACLTLRLPALDGAASQQRNGAR
jgi:hypothetical protein